MFNTSIRTFNHGRVSAVNTFVSQKSKTIVFMDSIASRLAAARTNKGWTQAQLAKEAGVSQGTVGNIESGVRRSHGSLPRLAEALGVSHNWLRDGGDLKSATPSVAADQINQTDGPAVMRTAVNLLANCLLDMDAEARKEAAHLMQEMAENPAGRWSGRLGDLIEKEATPGLWASVGNSVRAGNYYLGSQNPSAMMATKRGNAHSDAVGASNLPTGSDHASTDSDRSKDQGRSGGGSAGVG